MDKRKRHFVMVDMGKKDKQKYMQAAEDAGISLSALVRIALYDFNKNVLTRKRKGL